MKRQIRVKLDRNTSRRRFLHTAGGGLLALPLLNDVGKLSAQAPESPKRLIICFSPNGTIPEAYLPTGSGASFTLPEILSPLEAHKQDLVVIDNLDQPSAKNGPGGDAHGVGFGCLLNGIEVLEGEDFAAGMGGPGSGWPGGITVDQFVADRIGTETLFPSLEYTTKRMPGNIWSRMSYRGPGLPITPMDSPADAFDRVFAEQVGDPAMLARLRAQRESILDNSITEFETLATTLSMADRQKVEAHLAALRDVENRVGLIGNGSAACVPPARSELGSSKEPIYYVSIEETEPENDLDIPERHDAIREMVVAALACDLTRVASVILAPSRSPIAMTWLGIQGSHHQLSHDQNIEALIAINKFYAAEVAKLIADLKAIPEGTGSMWDNTLLVWCNELGLGWTHSHDHLPFLLAGSVGGYLKTAQLITVPDGIAQNDLLISICHAMGLTDVTTFGNPAYCTGPIAGLV